MRAIVIYYSLEGNTDAAARAIAQELGADTLRLETVTAYPTAGAKKFLVGGHDALTGALPELKPYAFDPDAYDTVVLGTPLWAWNATPAIRAFLKAHDLRGKKLALFITSMGGQDRKCFAWLAGELHAENAPRLSLIEPGRRPKAQHAEAIRHFCDEIRSL